MKKFFGKFSKTFILMGIMAGAFCVGEVKAAVLSDEIITAKIEKAKKANSKWTQIYWEVILQAKKNTPASIEELEKIYEKEAKAAGLADNPKSVKMAALHVWILMLEKVQTKEEAASLLETAKKIGDAKVVIKLVSLAEFSDKEALKVYSEISEKISNPTIAQSVFEQIKPLLPKVEEAEAKAVLKKLNRTWSGYLITQKDKGWDKVIAQIRTVLETY